MSRRELLKRLEKASNALSLEDNEGLFDKAINQILENGETISRLKEKGSTIRPYLFKLYNPQCAVRYIVSAESRKEALALFIETLSIDVIGKIEISPLRDSNSIHILDITYNPSQSYTFEHSHKLSEEESKECNSTA